MPKEGLKLSSHQAYPFINITKVLPYGPMSKHANIRCGKV